MPRSTHPVLTQDRLNRATLARQLLLERVPAGAASANVTAAIEQLGGFQAQEPASPYIALWTRLAGFRGAELDVAFHARQVIKATLLRGTLHAVSRADYRHLLPAVAPGLRASALSERLGRRPPADLDRLTGEVLAWATEPRTSVALREHTGRLAPDVAPEYAWRSVRLAGPFVHAPVDVRWSFDRRPWLVGAPSWLSGEPFADEATALEALVRRHLGAFGPAASADIAAWSGVAAGRLRGAIAAIEASDGLERFADERGRDLIDLVDAPRPAADVPAPPRLLPMWDSVLLAFADRTRVISDADRAIVIGRNGDTLPSFTVDGRVAGLWWAEADGGGSRIVLEPFRPLSPPARRELEAEADRLAGFVGPIEPEVYRRYRSSRARRPPADA